MYYHSRGSFPVPCLLFVLNIISEYCDGQEWQEIQHSPSVVDICRMAWDRSFLSWLSCSWLVVMYLHVCQSDVHCLLFYQSQQQQRIWMLIMLSSLC